MWLEVPRPELPHRPDSEATVCPSVMPASSGTFPYYLHTIQGSHPSLPELNAPYVPVPSASPFTDSDFTG